MTLRSVMYTYGQAFKLGAATMAVLAVLAPGAPVSANGDELSEELREALSVPLKKRVGEIVKEKNEDGQSYKRAHFSKIFRPQDDGTFHVTFHEITATDSRMVTERYLLTLTKDDLDKWAISAEELQDTYDGLRRDPGDVEYHRFDGFEFEREGIRATSGPGSLYTFFFEGEVTGFTFMADDLAFEYAPPKDVPTGYYQQLHKIYVQRFDKQLDYTPERGSVYCDSVSCKDILETAFTGLRKVSEGDAAPALVNHRDKRYKDMMKNRKENPFYGFRRIPDEDNRFWTLTMYRSDKHRVWLTYDNFDPEEVAFGLTSDELTNDFPATLFSYVSKETREAGIDPYELAMRDDEEARYHEVTSIKGTVELALEDPEMLSGDITFGLNIKRDLKVLPFAIATIRRGEGEERRNPTLSVNAVELEGKPLTVVRTGTYSGLVVFPEEIAGGSHIDLRMDFSTRAIYKVNHAFSAMARGGWLPFVRFADMIDTTDMIIKAPAKYKTLGIGKKIDERVEGDVSITHWVADMPVAFPTVIFGKYEEGKPRIEAKKADGTVIPVTVHVDEVSMGVLTDIAIKSFDQADDYVDEITSGARGIRPKQLIPIAEQAVNAINLFRELSGLDYPYGELNLVNDPVPAMYGQAPSSIIYLGSLVFRGEGTMAGGGGFSGRGGGTGTAKFLKSVVAHEVGHQWWGSRVSNANGRNYWFVETLAEYFSAVWLEAVFGEKEYQEQVDEWRRRILQIEQLASVQKATTDFGGEWPGAAYQASVYNKGPYAFHILRETFGDEKFFPALKKMTMDLAEKREICTEDIQMSLEEGLGGVDADGNPYRVDLSWFFDQWIRGIGIPEYSFNYTTRKTEDGGYIIEGVINQRVMAGQQRRTYLLEDVYYRGVVPITVTAKKGKEYVKKLVVEGPETSFILKVPERPLKIELNKNGAILAHDVLVNEPL